MSVQRRSVFLVKQLARRERRRFSLHQVGSSGVYTERSLRYLVNTQPPSLLVAHRPLDSIKLTVSEHAPRIRPAGRAVTDPMSGRSDPPGNARNGDDGSVLTLSVGGCCSFVRRIGCCRRFFRGWIPDRARCRGAQSFTRSFGAARLAGRELRRSSLRRGHGPRHRGALLPLPPRHVVRGRGGCQQRWTLSWPWPVNSNPGCLHQRRRMVATRWWCRGRGAPQARETPNPPHLITPRSLRPRGRRCRSQRFQTTHQPAAASPRGRGIEGAAFSGVRRVDLARRRTCLEPPDEAKRGMHPVLRHHPERPRGSMCARRQSSHPCHRRCGPAHVPPGGWPGNRQVLAAGQALWEPLTGTALSAVAVGVTARRARRGFGYVERRGQPPTGSVNAESWVLTPILGGSRRHPSPRPSAPSPRRREQCRPTQISVTTSPRGATMNVRTGSPIPRRSRRLERTQLPDVTGQLSRHCLGHHHLARGAGLHQAGQQVDEGPVVVAFPGRGGTDPHRPAGRGQDLVLGRRPADLDPDPTGGVGGRRGEEDLVADRLDDAAASKDGARPSGGLEAGAGQGSGRAGRSSGTRPSIPRGPRTRARRSHSGPRPRRRRQGWVPARTGPPRPGAAPARRHPSPTPTARRAPR